MNKMKSSLSALVLGLLLVYQSGFAQEIDRLNQLIEKKSYDEALALSNELLEATPDSENLQSVFGQLLVQTDQLIRAEAWYRGMITSFGSNPQWRVNLGVVLSLLAKNDEAIDQLKATIERFPEFEPAHMNLGDLYVRQAQAAYGNGTKNIPESKPLASRKELSDNFFSLSQVDWEEAIINYARSSGSPTEGVMKAFKNWLGAWSEKNIDAYLSHYSQEFSPSSGTSLREWIQRRTTDFQKVEPIRISARDISLKAIDKQTVSLSYTQQYMSGEDQWTQPSALIYKRVGAGWKIIQEDPGS